MNCLSLYFYTEKTTFKKLTSNKIELFDENIQSNKSEALNNYFKDTNNYTPY